MYGCGTLVCFRVTRDKRERESSFCMEKGKKSARTTPRPERRAALSPPNPTPAPTRVHQLTSMGREPRVAVSRAAQSSVAADDRPVLSDATPRTRCPFVAVVAARRRHPSQSSRRATTIDAKETVGAPAGTARARGTCFAPLGPRRSRIPSGRRFIIGLGGGGGGGDVFDRGRRSPRGLVVLPRLAHGSKSHHPSRRVDVRGRPCWRGASLLVGIEEEATCVE